MREGWLRRFQIKDFDGSDEAYEAISAMFSAVWPEDMVTAVSLKAGDARLEPGYLARREVVELDGTIVAWGSLNQ